MPFIIILFIQLASAAQVTTGFYKSLLDVQDKKGKEVKNPFNPTIGLGYNWQISSEWGFSPQVNYIYNFGKSEDGYNDYKIHTFSLLYDFVWLPFSSPNNFAFRTGLGTFIKKIKGEGGQVNVPNGSSGSSTAYRPDKTSTSYSATMNFGAEMTFDAFRDYFNNFGARFETFIFRPLSQEYRSYAYTLSLVGYF